MNADKISRLTESQRIYLRLVLQHHSSKQIAQRFGISAHTVDKRIKEAMRVLDVGTRVEAAQLLAAAEAGHPLGTQSPDLAIQPIQGTPGATEELRGDAGAISSGVMVGEEQLSFRMRTLHHPFPLPFPTTAQPENNLSMAQRLGWTIGLIIGLALATGILLSGLTALATLLIALGG